MIYLPPYLLAAVTSTVWRIAHGPYDEPWRELAAVAINIGLFFAAYVEACIASNRKKRRDRLEIAALVDRRAG